CSATAVLVTSQYAKSVKGIAVVVDDPYLAFAKISQCFDWREPVVPSVHPSAVISSYAQVSPSVQIEAGAVIEANAVIQEGCYIGSNTVVGKGATVKAHSRLEANVTLYPDVTIGYKCLIHSGAVIGADGFGFARSKQGWVKICQLGAVTIGDAVEIGANTTIDRGALEDTVIADGVKLDNQVQIAHNVQLGENTAIAGCTAVAGSTKIGANCTIAGMSGITGHLNICEGTHVTAMSLVSHSIDKPGAYSSGTGIEPHQRWKRNVVRFRQLDTMAKQLKTIQKEISLLSTKGKTK
ncbi:MAG: UDP-3-O-(3-hydroxymyristoyl)glucosamine N-acyltransferase, partial [Pseudomonadales bacterium]